MTTTYLLPATLQFYSPDHGGKSNMPIGSGYCPYLRVAGIDEDFAVRLHDLPMAGTRFDIPHLVELELSYHSCRDYSPLRSMPFQIIEGSHGHRVKARPKRRSSPGRRSRYRMGDRDVDKYGRGFAGAQRTRRPDGSTLMARTSSARAGAGSTQRRVGARSERGAVVAQLLAGPTLSRTAMRPGRLLGPARFRVPRGSASGAGGRT
jgi:hypothetical protein